MEKTGNFLEEALAKEGLKLTDEVIKIQNGLLTDIPIRLSVHVPQDEIIIHPFVLSTMLKSTAVDGIVNIIKSKKEQHE